MTSRDARFLAAIAEAPDDASLRWVYADWLEEQGDSRGELIRLEETIAASRVTEDGYWMNRDKRRDLRAQAGEEWLTALGYQAAWRPLLAQGWPSGLNERWRLIRAFIETWLRVHLPDVGDTSWLDRISELESKLVPYRLPPAVRKWVVMSLDMTCVYSRLPVANRETTWIAQQTTFAYDNSQGRLTIRLNPKRTVHPVSGDLLVIRGGLLNPPSFVIPAEELIHDDPPVQEWHLEALLRPASDSTSAFSLAEAILEIHGAGGGFRADVDDGALLRQRLAETFPYRVQLGALELFEAPEMLVALWEGRRLGVKFWQPSSWTAMPAFLTEHAASGESWPLYPLHAFRRP